MANRNIWLVLGWKSHDAKEPHVQLYIGTDGVLAEMAAADACASGEYTKGSIYKKYVTDWIPRSVVPTAPKKPTHGPTSSVSDPGAPTHPYPEPAKEIHEPPKDKSSMKRKFSIIAGALLLFFTASKANAQTYGFQQIADGIPIITTGVSNALSTAYIDCRTMQNVALQVQFCFASATTSNVVYTFSRSVDKVNWDTVNTYALTVAGNGTNYITCVTNLNVGCIGWLKLNSIENKNASVTATNLGIVYAIKRNAP